MVQIEESKREHSFESGQYFSRREMNQTLQQDFRITRGMKLDALSFEFRAEALEVVDFTVIDKTVAPRRVPERLIASWVQVDQGKPLMDQSEARLSMETRGIRAAMRNSSARVLQFAPVRNYGWIAIGYSEKSAHGLFS
jgi:hypothetical protein